MTIFLISGCGLFTKQNTNKNNTYESVSVMKTLESNFFWPYQIDSVVQVEHIQKMDKWHKNILKNDETGEPIYQYLYIKSESDGSIINYKLYKLPEQDSLYLYKKIMYR